MARKNFSPAAPARHAPQSRLVVQPPQMQLILCNKPFNTLCQFTDSAQPPRATLADFIPHADVYAAGRLDRDSEGLLLLTNHGPLQAYISHPKHKLVKTYWVQVEGEPTATDLQKLAKGVELKDGLTAPARVQPITPPTLWPRNPPVRFRANIATSWLEIQISEGRNRQVRRMTAHIGYPTLRLIRVAIGPWRLDQLQPGQWQSASVPEAICKVLKPQRSARQQPSKSAPSTRRKNTSSHRRQEQSKGRAKRGQGQHRRPRN